MHAFLTYRLHPCHGWQYWSRGGTWRTTLWYTPSDDPSVDNHPVVTYADTLSDPEITNV